MHETFPSHELRTAMLNSLKSSPDESRKSIKELFALMEKQSSPVVIAIDEFQQILEYPEQQTDAWLRSQVQRLKNVCSVFSGSQQHLMTGLFTNPDRPFYRSTQFMKIGKLKKKTYREFILDKCRSGGRLLKEQEFVFFGYREMLTKPRWELLRKELIDRETDGEGKSYLGIYDILSGRWISR